MSGSAASIPTDSSRIAPSGADTTLTESKLNPALSSKRWTLEPVEYDGTLCARNQAGLIVIPVDKDSRFRGKSKAMNATHGESVIRHRVLRLVCKKGNKYPFLSNQALRQELANFRFTISWQSQPTIDGGVLGAGVEAIGFECGSLRRVKNCVKLHLTALVDIVGVCASPVLELLIEESDGVTWWVNQRMALNFVWKKRGNRNPSSHRARPTKRKAAHALESATPADKNSRKKRKTAVSQPEPEPEPEGNQQREPDPMESDDGEYSEPESKQKTQLDPTQASGKRSRKPSRRVFGSDTEEALQPAWLKRRKTNDDHPKRNGVRAAKAGVGSSRAGKGDDQRTGTTAEEEAAAAAFALLYQASRSILAEKPKTASAAQSRSAHSRSNGLSASKSVAAIHVDRHAVVPMDEDYDSESDYSIVSESDPEQPEGYPLESKPTPSVQLVQLVQNPPPPVPVSAMSLVSPPAQHIAQLTAGGVDVASSTLATGSVTLDHVPGRVSAFKRVVRTIAPPI